MSLILLKDRFARVLAERPDRARILAERFPRIACFADLDVAGSIDVAEAAHMAEVSPGSLLAFVNGETEALERALDVDEAVPSWVARAEVDTCVPTVDAHAAIAAGIDPLEDVLALADATGMEGVFAVDAPFDPVPLRKLLAGKGFSSHAKRSGDGAWRVLFRRDGGTAMAAVSYDEGVEGALDLRGMEAPGPMVAVLRRIDSGEGGEGFTVLLERDPVFLYPELDDRGWSWCHLGGPEGAVLLRIEPNPQGLRK